MEFEKLELRHIKLPLKNPFETSFGRFEERNLAVLAAKKDERWFYGEASAQYAPLYQHETTGTDMDIIERFIGPAVKDAKDVEEYNRKVSGFRGSPMAKAAGDFLLNHIKSVRTGRPLAELVGGSPGKARCGISVGLEESPEKVLEKVRRYVDQGFTRVKLKVKPGKDIGYLETVREEFPQIGLMVDANASYTLEDLDRLQEIDRFNLMMIEQPLGYRDIVNHSILAEKIKTPICLDESIKSAEDVMRAAKLDACEIVNLKPQRVGGLMESKKIDEVCREEDIETWIGGQIESGIGASFAIAAAGLGSVSYPNDLAPSKRYFEEDVIRPEIKMVNGEIEIPGQEGLSGSVERRLLERYTVERRMI